MRRPHTSQKTAQKIFCFAHFFSPALLSPFSLLGVFFAPMCDEWELAVASAGVGVTAALVKYKFEEMQQIGKHTPLMVMGLATLGAWSVLERDYVLKRWRKKCWEAGKRWQEAGKRWRDAVRWPKDTLMYTTCALMNVAAATVSMRAFGEGTPFLLKVSACTLLAGNLTALFLTALHATCNQTHDYEDVKSIMLMSTPGGLIGGLAGHVFGLRYQQKSRLREGAQIGNALEFAHGTLRYLLAQRCSAVIPILSHHKNWHRALLSDLVPGHSILCAIHSSTHSEIISRITITSRCRSANAWLLMPGIDWPQAQNIANATGRVIWRCIDFMDEGSRLFSVRWDPAVPHFASPYLHLWPNIVCPSMVALSNLLIR